MDNFPLDAWWRQFRFAARSLVWVRLPDQGKMEPEDADQSLLWHSTVGLAIGILLAVLQSLLSSANSTIAAAIVLIAWVIVSGGMHLEHLPSAIKEWMPQSKHGESGQRITILALVAVLIVKFSALISVISSGEWAAIVVACITARASVAALLFMADIKEPFNYAGISAVRVEKNHLYLAIAASAGLCLLIGGLDALVLILVSAVLLSVSQRIANRDDQGVSGNSCHALVEGFEALALCVIAL